MVDEREQRMGVEHLRPGRDGALLCVMAKAFAWMDRYTLATKLVNELVEAADEKQLNKTIARYGRVELWCIDGWPTRLG